MVNKKMFLEELLRIIRSYPLEGVEDDVRRQLINFANYLLQPVVTPKELGITYATIQYWEKKNYLILQTEKQFDEWRKYTKLEALWFEILKKAESLGCSLEQTAPKIMFAYTNYTAPNCSVAFDAEAAPIMLVEGLRVSPFNNFLIHVAAIAVKKIKSSLFLTTQRIQFITGDVKPLETENKALFEQHTSGISICISDIVIALILGDKEELVENNIFSETDIALLRTLATENIKEFKINKVKKKNKYRMEINKSETANEPLELEICNPQNTVVEVNSSFKDMEKDLINKLKHSVII